MDSPADVLGPSPEETLIIDHSTLELTAEDHQYLANFRKWLQQKNAKAARKIANEERGPFQFLDLPPEIRDRIYGFAFMSEEVQRYCLSSFTIPAITRVSKQVRKESLPAFFSNAAFYITTVSNFSHRWRYRAWRNSKTPYIHLAPSQRPTVIKTSGILGVRNQVKKIIRAAGPSALFRHVTIEISKIDCFNFGSVRRDLEEWTKAMRQSSIHLDWESGQIQIRNDTRGLRGVEWNFGQSDVDEAIQDTENEARCIAGRQDFKGFTLSELEKIVRKLRFIMPALDKN